MARLTKISQSDIPISPEMLVPRLGEYLVQKGHISKDQLDQALKHQRKRQKEQSPLLLGEALVDLGILDQATLDQTITEQILQLRTALEDANKHLENRVHTRTAELQTALKKLSELNQLKANFVANISHELRTPLTHIKGYLELLSSYSLGPLNKEQENAVNISWQAAGRLEALINNLILFSVAARGEMTLKLVPVDLNKITSEVIGYIHPKATDRGVLLKINVFPNLPLVKADPEKISWVILQLLDNAIKFTMPGGNVTLTIQKEGGNLLLISVTDTGIGIPKNRTKEVFEAFHQLDGSSKRRFGGIGMGLALVHDIIEAHGSVIEVESMEGKGSSFHFPLLIVEDLSNGK